MVALGAEEVAMMAILFTGQVALALHRLGMCAVEAEEGIDPLREPARVPLGVGEVMGGTGPRPVSAAVVEQGGGADPAVDEAV